MVGHDQGCCRIYVEYFFLEGARIVWAMSHRNKWTVKVPLFFRIDFETRQSQGPMIPMDHIDPFKWLFPKIGVPPNHPF